MRFAKQWLLSAILLAGCGHKDDAPQAAAQTGGVPDADAGHMVYSRGCVSCHGTTGQGLVHQGTNLRTSQFVASSSDADLAAMIRKGRSAKDPANKSGVNMPAGGTIPGFGEDATADNETLADLVAYLRQVQREAKDKDAAVAARHLVATTAPAAVIAK